MDEYQLSSEPSRGTQTISRAANFWRRIGAIGAQVMLLYYKSPALGEIIQLFLDTECFNRARDSYL